METSTDSEALLARCDRIDRIEQQLENLTSVVSELTTNVKGNTDALAQLRESISSSNAQLRESIDVANDRITNNVQQLAGLMARASNSCTFAHFVRARGINALLFKEKPLSGSDCTNTV